ncbi:MAG TPA: flagellar filament capping protein FliD, partial [Mobilitalea sp.]|nr:flagellar filament capping protein FliD [Mobilitalea sp.]
MGTSPIRLSGLSSGMDTESMVNQMLQGEKLKQTNVHNKITTLQWTQDAWKNLNTKLYSFYTGSLSKMKMQGSFNAKKATSSDDSKVGITADVTAAKGTHTLQVNKLASSQFVTGAQVIGDVTSQTTLASLGFAIAGASINIDAGNGVKTLNIDDKTTVGDLVNKLKEAGLNASYDTTQKRFFISSKNSGLNNSFTITTTANGGSDLSTLGLSDLTKIGNTVSATNGNPEIKIVQPSDAEIVYNGATLTGSSNQFVVNGLTLTLKQTTAPGETLNLSVTNDTQAIYDSIKGFIKDYNALLNEMNTDYNAPS